MQIKKENSGEANNSNSSDAASIYSSKFELSKKNIKGILFDIDDTFTTEGRIPLSAFTALWRAYNEGLLTIAVTGRPAGWCDHIARMWPLHAIVGENGAFYFYRKEDSVHKHYLQSEFRIENKAAECSEILNILSHKVPKAKCSADQKYREFDLAIDICEEVNPPLSKREIGIIVDLFKTYNANVKISSIHINGWWGNYNKLTGVQKLFLDLYGEDLNQSSINQQYLFCGDSPNDVPMFSFFKKSVGVANIKNFWTELESFPRWVTSKESGDGFAELVNFVLDN